VRTMVAILQMYGYPDSAQDQGAAYSRCVPHKMNFVFVTKAERGGKPD
jgi:hypothetical protein